MKIYLGTGKRYFRIGIRLFAIDFDQFGGSYGTTSKLISQAIENSELFRMKIIKLKG
jgi:hypothetical protein